MVRCETRFRQPFRQSHEFSVHGAMPNRPMVFSIGLTRRRILQELIQPA
jgi:hypothetical protein